MKRVLFALIFTASPLWAFCIRSVQVNRVTGTLAIYGCGDEQFVITKADILAHFQGEVGTVNQRKAATLTWLKQQALASLPSSIEGGKTTLDINTADGTPDVLDISN